ncbi:MAG: hypothetical protein PHV98_06355 [Candidatus Omnitrophica bacterium]|nr:hypothetical protein [Candidatus Omnitrophota bacterium]
MIQKADDKNEPKKKCFFARMFEKLDKKMEEKARAKGCCCRPSDKGNDSCCK